MPKLTQAEARIFVCVRRLLMMLLDHFSESRFSETSVLLTLSEEIRRVSDTFDTEMAQLRADVAAQSSVIASATAAFRGLAAQLVAAEAAAKNAGATDAQIAGVSQMRQGLESNTAALASAIPANTPVVPTAQVPEPVTPPAPAAEPAASSSVAATAPSQSEPAAAAVPAAVVHG